MDATGSSSTPATTLATYRNLPNLLTLLRIAAIPVLVWLLRDPAPRAGVVAFVVYFLASITDFLDGYLARRYGLVTPLGKLLDPLADKLLVVSALVMIAVSDRTPTVPGWLLVIVIGREIAITGLRSIAAAEGVIVAAEATGKFKMILQTIAVHALILHYTYYGVSFHSVGMILLLVSAVAGVWSAVEYHVAVFHELSRRHG